jgi:hypothetical protein
MSTLERRASGRMRFAVATAVLLAGCSSTEPETDTGEIIVNGGFELPLGSAGWVANVVQGTSQFHTFGVDSTQAHSGRRSAMIRIHADHPSTVLFYNWFQPVTAGFEPARSYQLEAWGRMSNVLEGQRVFVEVRFYDINNAQLGREWTPVPGLPPSQGGQSQWMRLVIPFSVPAGTVVINLRAGNTAPFNAGATVWFDDFSIVPVGGP